MQVVALASFLAREKLRGSESAFRPYIECLPWDSLHPLLWTDDELDLIRGTYAHERIADYRDQACIAAGSGVPEEGGD